MKSTRPVAVITGAARGIGKGCALELARGGFNLLINDLPCRQRRKTAYHTTRMYS